MLWERKEGAGVCIHLVTLLHPPSPQIPRVQDPLRQERRLFTAELSEERQSWAWSWEQTGNPGACGLQWTANADRMACGQNCACCSCGPGGPWVLPAWWAALCSPLDPPLVVEQSHRLVSPFASGSHVWEAGLSLGPDLQGSSSPAPFPLCPGAISSLPFQAAEFPVVRRPSLQDWNSDDDMNAKTLCWEPRTPAHLFGRRDRSNQLS